MKNPRRLPNRAGLLLAGALVSPLAFAQAAPFAPADPWKFGGTLYLYLPSLDGKSSVPADGGTPINIDASKIVDSLQLLLMGTLEAHNGRWGGFTDLMYLNLGGNKRHSRDFTIGNIGLPAGTTAELDWDLEGVIWMVGGQYRLVANPGLTVDALGGARLFSLKQTTRWELTGDIGPITPAGRSGRSENKDTLVDAVVGFNGRVALGDSNRWSLPFYADVGAGESKLTWQAAGGVSYAYQWGDVKLMWRHIAYDLKSGNDLKSLSFSGPLLGATFRW